MSFNPKSPFSLKDLNTITARLVPQPNTARGVLNTYPFTLLGLSCIKEPKLGTSGAGAIQIFENGETVKDELTIPPKMYSYTDAVGFFDSLHDFELKFNDCEGDVYGNNYSFAKFAFSFLLKGGYPGLMVPTNMSSPTLIQNKYSYLNSIARPLNTAELENYFAIGNIYEIFNSADKRNGDIWILPNTRKYRSLIADAVDTASSEEIAWFTKIYDKLVDFFEEYRDRNFATLGTTGSGGTIKLICDHQCNMNKILKNVQNDQNKQQTPIRADFSILYTAETMCDSASKSKADKINDICGYDNWYLEELPSPLRRTYNRDKVMNDIKGNVGVTYNRITYSNRDDLENSDFTVNMSYDYYGITSSAVTTSAVTTPPEDIKMNAKSTTKGYVTGKVEQFIKGIIKEKQKFFPSILSDFIKTSLGKKNSTFANRQAFYTNFNTSILTKTQEELLRNFSINYARKRLGDTLQGRACKMDIMGTLKFKKVEQNPEYKKDKTLKSMKYKISSNPVITPQKGAVLLTHDRMLFSYAVINKIPVILDMDDNMIIYKPPAVATVVSGGSSDTASVGLSSQDRRLLFKEEDKNVSVYIEDPQLTQTGGLKVTEEMAKRIISNIDDFIRYLYFRTNIGYSRRDPETGLRIIRPFLKEVNEKVNNAELKIEYISKYNYDVLIIGSEDYIDKVRGNIDASLEVLEEQYQDRTTRKLAEVAGHGVNDLVTVPQWIMIQDGKNFLEVNRDGTGDSSSLNVSISYKGEEYDSARVPGIFTVNQINNEGYGERTTMVDSAEIIDKLVAEGYIEDLPMEINDDELNEVLDNISLIFHDKGIKDRNILTLNVFVSAIATGVISGGVSYFYNQETAGVAALTAVGTAVGTAARATDLSYILSPSSDYRGIGMNVARLASTVLPSLVVNLIFGSGGLVSTALAAAVTTQAIVSPQGQALIKNVSSKVVDYGKSKLKLSGGANPNEIPLYEMILDGNFYLLNNRDILLQNNITVLTFLFQLLREYELSFITYEEGIESFYNKIDESSVLSYTIGLNNWIPHDIEFYIFLNLLLKDYETKITSINYALFEYYLHKHDKEFNVYFCFKTIKDYLLKINYQIIVTPEIETELMSKENEETREYFESIIRQACIESANIIDQNYNARQKEVPDYSVVYENANKYSLKLCGFSDMREAFITKTYDIIGKMVEENSPLIQMYIPKAAEEEVKEVAPPLELVAPPQEEVVPPLELVAPPQEVVAPPLELVPPPQEVVAPQQEEELVPEQQEEVVVAKGVPVKKEFIPRTGPIGIEPYGTGKIAAGGNKSKSAKRKRRKEKCKTRKHVLKHSKRTKKNRKLRKRCYTKKA